MTAGVCDMGCQPDWHHGGCSIYLTPIEPTAAPLPPTTQSLLAELRASHGPLSVLDEVAAERARQEELWGEQNHPDGTGPYVLGEVVTDGRYRYAIGLERWAKRRCDSEHQAGRGTYEQILTEEWAEVISCGDPAKLRVELIQLAAVAAGWVEKIDRDLAAPAPTANGAS